MRLQPLPKQGNVKHINKNSKRRKRPKPKQPGKRQKKRQHQGPNSCQRHGHFRFVMQMPTKRFETSIKVTGHQHLPFWRLSGCGKKERFQEKKLCPKIHLKRLGFFLQLKLCKWKAWALKTPWKRKNPIDEVPTGKVLLGFETELFHCIYIQPIKMSFPWMLPFFNKPFRFGKQKTQQKWKYTPFFRESRLQITWKLPNFETSDF